NPGRPGGNGTGINIFSAELGAKRLGLLHDLMPTVSIVALLVNPHFPNVESYIRDVETAARAIGWQVRVLNAGNEGEINAAFAAILQERAEAVFFGADPFFVGWGGLIVALAGRHSIPGVFEARQFAAACGLWGY